jgi:3-oxoacyl-[acyl-carrier protein] reductase
LRGRGGAPTLNFARGSKPLSAKLDGKVALIIGGSRGIGAAISRRMAADGASVAIIHLSRADEAAALAAGIEAAGTRTLVIQADVADPAALSDAIDATVRRFGRLDILVNNAGLALTGPLEDYPTDAFDRMFAVNVRAPFLAARKAAAIMTQGGRIITIGSIVADRMPGAGGTLYAASKSALGGLTRGLARDLGPRGITANLVQPGPIDTERNPADGPNAAGNRAPLAIVRHGTADEVAGLVSYLASDEAAFVTGAVYNIDGGWSA